MTTVRRATANDARGIATVVMAAWRATYVGVMPQALLDGLDVDELESRWRTYMANDAYAVFVAEAEGRIVGFASVGPSSDLNATGELLAINVVPDVWSTGTGLALMDTAVAWLGERYDEAVLWVATENPRARRFYELYGWVVDGKRIDFFGGAEVPETRYRLSGLDRL